MSILGLDNETLAKLLQVRDVSAVAANVPLIENALQAAGILSVNCAIAAHATVAVETAWKFQPIDEMGSDAYFFNMYDQNGNHPNVARHLGNIQSGDGVKFHGRGFIQITGRDNYTHAGIADTPEKALDPQWSANYLADYFKKRGLDAAANMGRWTVVRRGVNGGTNGLGDFIACVNRLLAAIGGQ